MLLYKYGGEMLFDCNLSINDIHHISGGKTFVYDILKTWFKVYADINNYNGRLNNILSGIIRKLRWREILFFTKIGSIKE